MKNIIKNYSLPRSVPTWMLGIIAFIFLVTIVIIQYSANQTLNKMESRLASLPQPVQQITPSPEVYYVHDYVDPGEPIDQPLLASTSAIKVIKPTNSPIPSMAPPHDGSKTGAIIKYYEYSSGKDILVYENELLPLIINGTTYYRTKADIDLFNRYSPSKSNSNVSSNNQQTDQNSHQIVQTQQSSAEDLKNKLDANLTSCLADVTKDRNDPSYPKDLTYVLDAKEQYCHDSYKAGCFWNGSSCNYYPL